MIETDPKTRHMTRHELSQILNQLETPGGEGDPFAEKTRLWQRAPRVETHAQQPSDRITEPVTELDLVQVLAAKPSPSSAETRISKVARPTVSLRGRGLGIVSLLLVMGTAAGFAVHAGRARLESTQPATSGGRALAPTVAPVAAIAPVERDVPSHLPGASERAAVDQLISGHLREALDSYRALALAHGDQPAFAFVAAQLERELRSCEAGDAPCAR